MTSCGWFPLSQDEIAAWVAAHRDELPTTLDELSAYPIPFRRAIVSAVSTEQRIGFWDAHLRTFLAPDAGLTTEQRAVVADALPLLPGIFGSPQLEAQARMRPIEERAADVFSRPQRAAIFGMVGPPEPPEGLPLPPGTRLTPAG